MVSEDKARRFRSVAIIQTMNFHILLETDFQYFLLTMGLAFAVAVAVAEILAQRKHRTALQTLRTGRHIHQKGGHQ